MKRTIGILICILMLASTIMGCSAPVAEEVAKPAPEVVQETKPEAAPAEKVEEVVEEKTFTPITVSFLHGAGGSTWPMLAEGVGECIRRVAPGSSVTTVPGGAVSNAQLVSAGEYELGFTFYDTLLDVKNGRGAFEGAASDNLKVIACVFSTYSQPFTLAEQPFNTLAEFFAQQPKIGVSMHQAGSGVETFNKRLVEAHGYTYDDITAWGGNVVFANEADSTEMFKDGQIEMFFGGSTPPVSNNIDINTTRPIKYLKIDEEIIQKMMSDYGYGRATITKDTYEWLEEDFDTFTAMIVVTCTTDMSDDDTYMIAKAINENIDYLCGVHNAAKLQMKDIDGGIICNINEEDIAAGALAYYKEVGLK